jgi:hypothetical protein
MIMSRTLGGAFVPEFLLVLAGLLNLLNLTTLMSVGPIIK